jgi:DNA-binding NarL/FixJ family response regulator
LVAAPAKDHIIIAKVSRNVNETILAQSRTEIDVTVASTIQTQNGGLETFREILLQFPSIPLLLAGSGLERKFLEAIILGVSGFILPPLDSTTLLAAIQKVHHEGLAFPPWGFTVLVGLLRSNSALHGGSKGLSTREQQIMAHLLQNLPNKAIAQELGIAPATVHTLLIRMFGKLGVRNRSEAIKTYLATPPVAGEDSAPMSHY